MELEAGQFLRALRGRRSQVAWARRLGYQGNPITNWERGKRFPTALEVLRVASIGGYDVRSAFARFASTVPLNPQPEGYALASWLNTLRGGTTFNELALRCGRSRHSVRRWLLGEAEPRLPDFFRLIDALTSRLPDWVAAFVPIESVPSFSERHRRAAAAKSAAFDAPWTEAILRLLETTHFSRLRKHDADLISECCGIDREEALRCIALLVNGGIVTRTRGKYSVTGGQAVDTQGGRAALHRLKAHWADVATRRLMIPPLKGDLFAYNVVSVAECDVERIAEILRAAYREIRALVAASEPAESVALINLQLVRLFSPSGPTARVAR